jgi:hypothetical protein
MLGGQIVLHLNERGTKVLFVGVHCKQRYFALVDMSRGLLVWANIQVGCEVLGMAQITAKLCTAWGATHAAVAVNDGGCR